MRCIPALIASACLLILPNIHAGILAQFRTVFGDIEVELFEKDKPITVSNFIAYVQSGRYGDSFIHRYVTNFVIQGGGYKVTERGTTNASLDLVETFPPIKNEYGSGNIYSNRYGTIAMAKVGGNTNSATSQWFFNLADNFFLDSHDSDNFFTVFGRVVRGTNVLNTFRTFRPWSGSPSQTNVIVDYSFYFGPAFSDWPFLTGNQTYDDLIYVDVSLLNVQVQNVNNAREISWKSVSGKTNRVEFTTTMPPVWNLLVATNGNGNTIKIRDTSMTADHRFYRVVVAY